jgi:hypothetical protein
MIPPINIILMLNVEEEMPKKKGDSDLAKALRKKSKKEDEMVKEIRKLNAELENLPHITPSAG